MMAPRFDRARLLGIDQVRTELKIDDAQSAVIDAALDAYRDEQNNAQRPDREAVQNMSEEERTKLFTDMQKQRDELSKKTDDVLNALLEDSQKTRLDQISLQLRMTSGIAAFLKADDIKGQLKISDEQVAKLDEAELIFRRTGITFAVYTEGGDPERLIPFDIIPRVLDAREWSVLERGLAQRVRALNAFIADVYGPQEFVRSGKIPAPLVLHNPGFAAEMVGLRVPAGVYTHIAGIDMVRVGPDEFYVLEDNCRTPSGVSYMLENREATMRLFPDLIRRHRIRPVSHYPEDLLGMLRSVAPPAAAENPTVVLLTPGSYNSAYYEHSFLADEMGVELVEGVDLMVEDLVVYMRTTRGRQRVENPLIRVVGRHDRRRARRAVAAHPAVGRGLQIGRAHV